MGVLTPSIFTMKQIISRSCTSLSLSTAPSSSFSSLSFSRQCPLVALAARLGHTSPTAATLGGFATQFIWRRTYIHRPNPRPNRRRTEMFLPDGCDKEHWIVHMDKPEGEPTRDDIIDSYIKTLAQVVGSEDEARRKIYTVSTEPAPTFGAHVSEEISSKIKELPKVSWVHPDIYLGIRKKIWKKDKGELPRAPGCDFEHWLVVMEVPKGDPTRDEIIDSYIKTLAQVVGSEDEARMKIYSVSTKYYFAFGAVFSEELCDKIKALPKVFYVFPDAYVDVEKKAYGGEPFINGQAVPYDPKYHEEYIRNEARLKNTGAPNKGGMRPNTMGGSPPIVEGKS